MSSLGFRGVLAIGATALIAVGAAACGGDDSSSTTTAAAPAATTAAATTAAATSDTAAASSDTAASTDTAAASSDTAASTGASGAAGGSVGVILPDTKSSIRWESFDRPLLTDAFKAAGVQVQIQNAEGDKNRMASIADQMITSGVKVLMIVNLDSQSGAAIEKKAADAGVQTIDYDRLTLGGSAAVYVSFDAVKVGTAQGEGLVKCITDKGLQKPAIAVLNGSPTDNNATLFKQGYDAVINPKFDSGEWTKVDDQSVPDWDNQKAGQIFEQMLTKANGKVDGVLAANDGLANAVIAVLKKNNLQVPVTGQDATPEGLRNILAGDQCMTVYKAVADEANAAAAAAVALLGGQQPDTKGATIDDTESGKKVPAVLLPVTAIFKDNVKVPIDDGFVKAADVCTPEVKAACDAAGIK
jgi:D-xylose transport system substrate-binding protein